LTNGYIVRTNLEIGYCF